MLADDDPDDRDLFTEAISENNVAVKAVPNGVQLMKVLTTNTELPDFIFLRPEHAGKKWQGMFARNQESGKVQGFAGYYLFDFIKQKRH